MRKISAMKKVVLLLLCGAGFMASATGLSNKQWRDTVIKRNVEFEGDYLKLGVIDGRQTGYFHDPLPGKKGEKFVLTVKVRGKGMLDAGYFGYTEKGKFLGRFPKVLPRKIVDSKEVVTLQYQFENTTDAHTIRPHLLIRKGNLVLISADLAKVESSTPAAMNLPNDQWRDTVIKRKVEFEGAYLKLGVTDGRQTGYFHKTLPGKKGEKFVLTVKVRGKGMLDAGYFGYSDKGKFLGRFPKVLPRKIVDSEKVVTLNYYLENTTDAHTISPHLLIRKGNLVLISSELARVDAFPEAEKPVNHLDSSRKMDGEWLPEFTEPNLLKEAFAPGSLPKWQITGGKAEIKDNELVLSLDGKFGRIVAVSPGIKPGKTGKYLLTALYQSQDLKFGSSAEVTMVRAAELKRYLARFNQVAVYSSFSGNEVYNRRPGDWQRVGSSHEVTEENKDELWHFVIVFQGRNAQLRWGGVYFGLGPWNPDNRKAQYDWNKVVNKLDPLYSEEDTLKILAERPEVSAELKFSKGSPKVMLCGRETVPLFYVGDANRSERSKLQDFRNAGINIQMIFADKKVWCGNKKYDFATLDRLMMDALRRNPHGNFVPVLSLSPYESWGDEFPSEVAVDAEGKPTVSRHGRKAPPCYWSPVYRQQAVDYLRAAVEHMKSQVYFKAVAGVFITGNEDGQFYYQIYNGGRLGDADSPGLLPVFRAYLKEKYRDVKELQKAWKKSDVTFENARPGQHSLSVKGNFFDPSKDMQLVDTIRFLNESHGDFMNQMCNAVKDTAGKKILTVMWFGRGASQLVYPQFSQMSKILVKPGLDLMGAQPGYRGERHSGCSSFFSEVFDSVRSHNKLAVCEADYRTWTGFILSLQHDIFNVRYWSRHDLTGAIWREAGKLLSTGGGLWFYDMCGGYFKDPVIMSDIAKLRRGAEKLLANPDPFTPSEMVLVADEENFYYTTEQLNIHNGPNYRTVRKTQRALMRAGLKYDFYYLEDMISGKRRDYKLYVFMNVFHLSARKKAYIESLKRDGKTLVFLYAPGYLSDNGVSVEGISRITGIKTALSQVRLKNSTFCESPLSAGLSGYAAGIGNNMGGESFCIKDAKAVPLMHYANGEVSGAYRDFGTYKVVYLAPPSPFTPEFLQQLARYAGVHVYNLVPGDMFVQRRSDLAVLHGVEGKLNLLDYPGECELTDLITGEKIGKKDGKFAVKLVPGETKLISIGKAAVPVRMPENVDQQMLENLAKELKFSKPVKILWIGDSLSDLNRENNFIALAEKAVNKYHPGMLKIGNFGVRGDYITRIIRRINGMNNGVPPAYRQEMYDKIFAEKYDMMVCFLGHNDTRLDMQKDPAGKILVTPEEQVRAYKQLSAIMEKFDPAMEQVYFSTSASDGDFCRKGAEINRKKGRPVVLFGDEKTMKHYNAVLQQCCRELNVRFVDIDTPMRQLSNRSELFADGVHLSAKGNMLMAWKLLHFLKESSL